MKTKSLLIVVLSVLVVGLTSGFSYSKEFRIILMQDEKGAAERYSPLMTYLKKNDFDVDFVTAPNYSAASKMFASGAVDAIFSGSGVAGALIIKDLAYPIARPVSKGGGSTYHAVVIARKGASKFTDTVDYFNGKRIIFTALASSGEFYYRSNPKIKSINSKIEIAASHGGAIDALSRGAADVAIVKNLVWEKYKDKYPGLEKVKDDNGENPEMPLMISNKADAKKTARLSRILLALENDKSPDALEVKNKLGIQGYATTTRADFKHTIFLLKKAGVTKSFDFNFK